MKMLFCWIALGKSFVLKDKQIKPQEPPNSYICNLQKADGQYKLVDTDIDPSTSDEIIVENANQILPWFLADIAIVN